MFLNRYRGCLLALAFCTAGIVRAEEETVAARRTRVANMSAEEKEELRQKQERFTGLSDTEKTHLRDLHSELSTASDGERLKNVLERYHAWLATLSSAERAALLSLPADQRLAKMKEIIRVQEEKQFRELVKSNLQPEDRKAIILWLENFVKTHEKEVLAEIPKEFRPPEINNRNRWPVMQGIVHRWAENDPKMPRPSQEEVETLLASLSPKAGQAIANVREPGAKVRMAQEWIRAAIASRYMPTLPPIDPEELRRFSTEELSPQERERLENLPADEMPVALQRAYYEHRWRRGGGPGFGQRGGPGGRGPGERGPGDRGPGERGPGDKGGGGPPPDFGPDGPPRGGGFGGPAGPPPFDGKHEGKNGPFRGERNGERGERGEGERGGRGGGRPDDRKEPQPAPAEEKTSEEKPQR